MAYKLINKLNCSGDLNRDIACKYDAGKVTSEKYGEATLTGHFLLLTRPGEFPTVNIKQIEEKCYYWLNEMGLEEYREEAIEKIKMPTMIAYTAPQADPDRLELYFKVMLFGFLYDDAIVKLNHLNENDLHKQQEDILKLVENLISIINSYGDGHSREAAVSALHPMFKTICTLLSNACTCSSQQMNEYDYTCFATELMDFIRVYKWLQEYHKLPYNKNEFLFLRCVNVFMSPALVLICFAKDIRIAKEIRTHPLFQRYYKNVCMHEAFRNDVLSLQKEIADNEEKNFVLIECRKYSLQRAIYKAEKAANELIIDLKKDAIKLRSYFPADESLKNFIETAEYAVDGFLYWYQYSERYGNMKFETYVVEYDYDYNNWLEQIGINNAENMKEPVLKLESNDGTVALPSFPSFYA